MSSYSKITNSTWRVFLGAFFIGMAPIFVKLVSLPPTTIGFYRCLLGSFIFFCFPSPKGTTKRWRPTHTFLLLAGIIFAVDLYVWHRSVFFAGAGIATILGNTQVFYVSLFGFIALKEKPKYQFLIALFIAFWGVFLLVDLQPQSSHLYRMGIFFGALTGLVYAFYILILRHVATLNQVPMPRALAWVCLTCALSLGIVCFFEGTLILPSHSDWLHLLLLSGVSQVLGWYLISTSLSKVPAAKTGIVLLVQPVTATLLGAALFNESLNLVQGLGVGLALYGIYLGTRFSR